jgi:hypothetical protein
MGMFESWTRVMGGILEAVGISGFLDNRQKLRERADNESQAWRGFVQVWWRAQEDRPRLGKPMTTHELLPMALEFLGDKIGEGTERSQKTKLGLLLVKNLDRIYAGKKICRAENALEGAHSGAARFYLEDVEKPRSPDSEQPFSEPSEHSEPFSPKTREKEENQNQQNDSRVKGKESPSECSEGSENDFAALAALFAPLFARMDAGTLPADVFLTIAGKRQLKGCLHVVRQLRSQFEASMRGKTFGIEELPQAIAWLREICQQIGTETP